MFLLLFIYSGEIQTQYKEKNVVVANLYPHTQFSVNTICGLLRLSDRFLLEFLKQWCELYLSNSVVLTLYNVCDLLQL